MVFFPKQQSGAEAIRSPAQLSGIRLDRAVPYPFKTRRLSPLGSAVASLVASERTRTTWRVCRIDRPRRKCSRVLAITGDVGRVCVSTPLEPASEDDQGCPRLAYLVRQVPDPDCTFLVLLAGATDPRQTLP